MISRSSTADERAAEALREEATKSERHMADDLDTVMGRFEPQENGDRTRFGRLLTPRTRWAFAALERIVDVLEGADFPRDPNVVPFAEVANGWRDVDGTHVVLRDGTHLVRELAPEGKRYEWKEQEPIAGTFRAAVMTR